MGDLVYLANGKSVPRICVEELDKFEVTWPGATFPGARPAIVLAILEALIKRTDPDLKFMISKEDLTTDRPDMISVVREELRQNVGESLIKKDRGDLLEIVILTKENVSNVAKETGRSEQALRDALSHAKVMDRVCYIAYRYLE